MLHWSTPYHGVQHLEGHALLKIGMYRVKVEDFGCWARAYMTEADGEWGRPMWEAEFATPSEARTAAEAWFALFIGGRNECETIPEH